MADEKDEGCEVPEAVPDGGVDGRAIDKERRGGMEGAPAFVQERGKDILLCALCAALLGVGGYCVALRGENATLRRKLMAAVSHSGVLARRVRKLEGMNEEKDEWFKALASDALRHGSHFAGKCMRDRRDYLNGRA